MITATRICWTIGIAALVGLTGWRLEIPLPPPVNRYVLVDVSRSDAQPCAELQALIEKIIAQSPFGHVRFFATGSVATAFEPVPIPIRSAPAREHLMEAADAANRQNAAFVSDVVEACKSISSSDSSPIFLAIKHVVAQARQGGGTPEVYVISDLEESAEPRIVRGLRVRGVKPRLPEPIDNKGVRVYVCGFAQTKGRMHGRVMSGVRTAARADRLLETWHSLFTDPGAVEFLPFCS